MFLAVVLPILIIGASAQIRLPGRCNITAMEDFNVTQSQGWWYEYARYPIINSEPATCPRQFLSLLPDGSLAYRVVYYPLHSTDFIEVDITSSVNGPHMVYSSPKFPAIYEMEFTIMSTDYTSYMIQGHCAQDGDFGSWIYWIFLRQPFPTIQAMVKVAQVIEENQIPVEYLEQFDDASCPLAISVT